ncbi:hypothetical protein DSECCO2_251500 [anaerobic digester metagenome]
MNGHHDHCICRIIIFINIRDQGNALQKTGERCFRLKIVLCRRINQFFNVLHPGSVLRILALFIFLQVSGPFQ